MIPTMPRRVDRDYRAAMSFRTVALIALTACGRIGFDATTNGDGRASGDGAEAGTLGRFGDPVAIAELNSSRNEYGPTISADGNYMILTSNRGGSYALYEAIRLGGTFSTPAIIAPLGSTGIEYDADLSATRLEAHYIASEPPKGLRHSTRASAVSPWATPTIIPLGADHEGPSLALGDLRMLIATSTAIDEWGRPDAASTNWQRLRTHTSLANLTWPAFRSDGLEVFAIDNDANYILYRATRTSVDSQFGPAERYLFGGSIDNRPMWDPELSPDGRTLLISIDVSGDYDIHIATR